METEYLNNIKKSCSPDRDKIDGCLNLNEVKDLVKKFNKVNHEKIKIQKKNKTQLWYELQAKLNNECNNDKLCIVKKYGNSKMLSNFRPFAPNHWMQNNRAWLSNYDLQDVLYQYEKKYKTFKFLGVFSIDFYNNTVYCPHNMCNFNINAYPNKKILSIVMNLSKHHEPGSHWVALMINVGKTNAKRGIYYYDSSGTSPPNIINPFINLLKKQIKEYYSFDPQVHHNNNVHQYGLTECGIFCIHFIESFLKSKINKRCDAPTVYNLIPVDKEDNIIHGFRNVFFNF